MMKLKSRTGMSLIEVMVTTAVAGVVMVAIGNSMISLYQHQTTITHKDEGNEFAADFSRLLSQNDVCTNMLNGVVLKKGDPPIQFVVPDYITSKKNEALVTPSADDLRADNDISAGLRVLSLTIQNSSLPEQEISIDLDPNDASTTLTEVFRRVAEVELRLGLVKPGEIQEMKPRRFQVPVVVLKTGETIHSCATELQVADACSALQGSYNPASGSCSPGANCFMKGAFTVINCRSSDGNTSGCPDPVLNPITSGQNCPGGGVATESGRNTYEIIENCGKKCTRRLEIETIYYICLECA